MCILTSEAALASLYWWQFGSGPGSSLYWNRSQGPGSVQYWKYGRDAGSDYYWKFGTGVGSQQYWLNAQGRGSLYFWNNGKGPGSKYYWENGKGPGSQYFWENGTGPSITGTLLALCLTKKITISPCQSIPPSLIDSLSNGPQSCGPEGVEGRSNVPPIPPQVILDSKRDEENHQGNHSRPTRQRNEVKGTPRKGSEK